jgi:hypothetical protein
MISRYVRATLATIAAAALIATFLFSLSLTAASTTLAVSPSQQQCQASGGTFSRDGGQVSCTYSTTQNVGNSDHSQTTTTTTTSQSNGTLNNDPQYSQSKTCAGPGNSGANSAHC